MSTFKILGFPVTVTPLFLVMTVLLAFGRLNDPPALVLWVTIVVVSILIHELGHALAFRRYGRSARIELHGMGGVTYSEGNDKPFTPMQDAAVSAAGPAASYVVALLVYLAAMTLDATQRSPLVDRGIQDLLWVNAGWATINLLPIYPLDGGQILQAFLRLKSPKRAKAVTLSVSVVVAVVAMAFAYRFTMTFAAILAFWFGASNLSELMALRRAAREGGERDHLAAAVDAFHRGDFDGALAAARQVYAAVAKGELHHHARQIAGIAALKKGLLADAWDEVAMLPDRMVNRELLELLAGSLFEQKDWARAEAVSAKIYEVYGVAQAAYQAACARCLRGDPDGALRWLDMAIDAGYQDSVRADADPHLAQVRASSGWPKLRDRMGR